MQAKSRKRCHLSKRKTFQQKPQLREVNDDHKAGYTRTQSPRQEVLDVLKSLNVHAKEEQNDEVTGREKRSPRGPARARLYSTHKQYRQTRPQRGSA